jgi:hypothetical protein
MWGPASHRSRPADVARTTRPERSVSTPRRAIGRSPHTWSCRSRVARQATGLRECPARRRPGTERARSPARSRSNSGGARAGLTVDRAPSRRGEQTAPPDSRLRVFGENESRTARRSFVQSPASRAPFDSGSKCPVRRSSDLFIQLADLALSTPHCIVSRHLGFSQERHLSRILVRLACATECQRVAVETKRVGSFPAQRREQRLQLLAPPLELGCALSQVAVFRDVPPARLRRREDAELRLPPRFRSVQQWTHAYESRAGALHNTANDHVYSTLRPFCKYLPHESGRTQERRRVRLAASHPITRMWLLIVARC